jgi:hypothetical protein
MPLCPFQIAGRKARIDTERLWATRRACSLALLQRLVGKGEPVGGAASDWEGTTTIDR